MPSAEAISRRRLLCENPASGKSLSAAMMWILAVMLLVPAVLSDLSVSPSGFDGDFELAAAGYDRDAELMGIDSRGYDREEGQARAGIAGFPVSIEHRAFHVSVEEGKAFLCSGFILLSKYAVTAAHCVKNKTATAITVRAGSIKQLADGTAYAGEEIWTHPTHLDYDVAVIAIKDFFAYSLSMEPAFLSKDLPSPGSLATVSGWGRPTADVLKTAVVKIIDSEECRIKLGLATNLTDSQFCGVRLEGPCIEDDGAPLTDLQTGKIIGIVSSSAGCEAGDGRPTIYVNSRAIYDTDRSQIEGAYKASRSGEL